MTGRRVLIFVLTAGFLIGCLDPYPAPKTGDSKGYLVVDGVVNVSESSARVRLSRTIGLDSEEGNPPVVSAQVTILGSLGAVISLTHSGSGIYETQYPFRMDEQYKLTIRTGDKNYESEEVAMVANTAIDSLVYQADKTSLQVRTYAHKDGADPGFYRFNYEETYEYRAAFASLYRFNNGYPLYREPSDDITSCWLSSSSASIMLTSTEGLADNVIPGFLVREIQRGDPLLWFKYSILVRQFALDKKTWDYWNNVQTVSQSLGGLFDPIPFSVQGNIRCTSDPTDRVLGYFSGGQVSTSRIVIANTNLPTGYYSTRLGNCIEEYVELRDLPTLVGRNIEITRAEYMGIFLLGYYFTLPSCADCRFQGGDNVRPPFM